MSQEMNELQGMDRYWGEVFKLVHLKESYKSCVFLLILFVFKQVPSGRQSLHQVRPNQGTKGEDTHT